MLLRPILTVTTVWNTGETGDMYWNRPFKIGTIQNPNLKMFGIGMAFGIPSLDFEPPLDLDPN